MVPPPGPRAWAPRLPRWASALQDLPSPVHRGRAPRHPPWAPERARARDGPRSSRAGSGSPSASHGRRGRHGEPSRDGSSRDGSISRGDGNASRGDIPGRWESRGDGATPPGAPGGVSYPGALQPSHAPQQNFVEEFSSLQLGGGGPGGDQGVDPATFPRPGDDIPNPNSELSCDPRYLRLTCGALPVNQSVKQRFGLPVACLVRPLIPGENVPVAQFGSSGIVRCRRCRTYINPFVQFIDGGRRFRCNVCQLPNEVPVDYFCTLDANGRRRDVHERPELRHGTVEFLASQEYMVRPPMPPTYFFAFDVSAQAVSSGFLAVAVQTIKETLDSLPGGERTRVGFLTYDSTLHFYALKPGSSQPQMMVVAELDDPFCPAPDDLLVNLQESRDAVDALLDMLPGAFAETNQVDSCMGPAIQAAYMAMNHIGGKLMVFQCTLPSLGSGRLLNRGDDHRNAGTDKEHQMRAPADPFFKKISAECSRQQICVDVFASASPYADLASLAVLPRCTGGQVYHYPAFRVERDGPKLKKELAHNLTRFTAWEAVCRVRCSKGFRVSSFNGHFFIRSMDLLALPYKRRSRLRRPAGARRDAPDGDGILPAMRAAVHQRGRRTTHSRAHDVRARGERRGADVPRGGRRGDERVSPRVWGRNARSPLGCRTQGRRCS